eukprot:4248194-Amphidinium_carterae.1
MQNTGAACPLALVFAFCSGIQGLFLPGQGLFLPVFAWSGAGSVSDPISAGSSCFQGGILEGPISAG